MNRSRTWAPWFVAALVPAAIFVGCASAGPPGADDMGGDSDGDGDGPADAGAGFVDARPLPDAAIGPGTPDAAVGPGTPDAAPQGSADAAPMNDCASAATCVGAVVLGTTSGDTGNTKLTAQGHQAAWFRVRVSENNEDIFGLSLRVGATLVSPPGVDYDVFIYLNDNADALECNASKGTKTNVGSTEQVRHEWGEFDIFANGSDDDRDVSIEVRPVSGVCSAAQPWQLEIEGNWN